MNVTRQEAIGYRLMTGLSVPSMSWLEAAQAVAVARLHMQYNNLSVEDVKAIAERTRISEAVKGITDIIRRVYGSNEVPA